MDMHGKAQNMLLELLNDDTLSGFSTTWRDGIAETCLPSVLL